ncbi:MAG: galactose-1-phosphate uridylyltransferase, partial [Patescibacteria group bacterium]|nr:galactose-1-phosphate uridylyltransferase [Patescibacteria group bacterium]
MPQLRQNIITGDWVVIAPERAKRPNDYVSAEKVKRQAKKDCVFCLGKEEYQKRLKEYDTKSVWLIPNK